MNYSIPCPDLLRLVHHSMVPLEDSILVLTIWPAVVPFQNLWSIIQQPLHLQVNTVLEFQAIKSKYIGKKPNIGGQYTGSANNLTRGNPLSKSSKHLEICLPFFIIEICAALCPPKCDSVCFSNIKSNKQIFIYFVLLPPNFL